MLTTTAKSVADTAKKLINAVQGDKVCNQILGLGALLICMIYQYNLNYTDILGIADNMVYSGDNNNMKPDFKAIQNYMKDEWEI